MATGARFNTMVDDPLARGRQLLARVLALGGGPRLIASVGVLYGIGMLSVLELAEMATWLPGLVVAWPFLALLTLRQWEPVRLTQMCAVAEGLWMPGALLLAGIPVDLVAAVAIGLVAAGFAQGGLRLGILALLAAAVSATVGLVLQPLSAAPPGPGSAAVGAVLLLAWGTTMGLLGYHQRRELRALSDREHTRLERMERVATAYGRYLSPQVRSALFDTEVPLPLPRRRRWVTVMFADMAGFTHMTEIQEAEQLASFVNDYLEAMAGVAVEYGGTIDKFIGDAVMVFFGDPDSRGRRQDAVDCVRMAVAMRQRLRELVEDWRVQGTPLPLRARIGVASGYCTVGSFGAAERMDYTLLGSAVNLASRLQGQAREDQILVAPATWSLVQGDVPCRTVGARQLRGFTTVIDVYEVVAARSDTLHLALPGLELRLDPEVVNPAEARVELDAVLERISGGQVSTRPGNARPLPLRSCEASVMSADRSVVAGSDLAPRP